MANKYRILRAILFLFPPETAHLIALKLFKLCCLVPGASLAFSWYFGRHRKHPTELFGLRFENPVGLAAGFDKNGSYIDEMGLLGFGFIEIGSVTALPAQGNPKPRLFRLKQDNAIINRMGLNNRGVDVLVEKLKSRPRPKHPLFINVAKTPDSHIEGALAIDDYCSTIRKVSSLADVIVINISCPNSGDGRTFESEEALEPLLRNVREIVPIGSTPILIKVSPDLSDDALEAVVRVAHRFDIDGFTATNTTVDRSNICLKPKDLEKIGPGGLSGLPLHEKAVDAVRRIRALTSKPIIGVGGIRSQREVKNFLNAGANLVQVYTGFIYQGPGMIKKICAHLDD